jgi:hypothetical protein
MAAFIAVIEKSPSPDRAAFFLFQEWGAVTSLPFN